MKMFHLPINKVSVAQLAEHLIAEQGPRCESRPGRYFFTKIPFNEEMNQMVKTNKDKNNNK